ncbi:MAG TPA: hypothetical protein VGL49_06305, partial [Acidimicrobiales bacterium]
MPTHHATPAATATHSKARRTWGSPGRAGRTAAASWAAAAPALAEVVHGVVVEVVVGFLVVVDPGEVVVVGQGGRVVVVVVVVVPGVPDGLPASTVRVWP